MFQILIKGFEMGVKACVKHSDTSSGPSSRGRSGITVAGANDYEENFNGVCRVYCSVVLYYQGNQ